MKNPFDKLKEPEKFNFFEEMTDAIDKWMVEKYPQFDKELFEKMNNMRLIHQEVIDKGHQILNLSRNAMDWEELEDLIREFKEFRNALSKRKK